MLNGDLIQKLKGAYQVCHDCGMEYGERRDSISTIWHDKCDVCGVETAVTEARDYGFLWKGILNLTGTKTVTKPTESEIKYKSKIHSISITREDDYSFFGTEVRIDDNGDGVVFLVIIDTDGSEICLEFEEFDLLVKAVETLRNQ